MQAAGSGDVVRQSSVDPPSSRVATAKVTSSSSSPSGAMTIDPTYPVARVRQPSLVLEGAAAASAGRLSARVSETSASFTQATSEYTSTEMAVGEAQAEAPAARSAAEAASVTSCAFI